MPLRFAGLACCLVPIFAQDVFLKVKDTRPNIVWIMADDLGYGEVGLYPASSEHGRIATPNLDTFGKEGIKFNQAYAGYTVCGPSRMTFFTGRHSGQFANIGNSGTDLAPGVTTLANVLQDAGYATGAFGKTSPLESPEEQGFDIFLGQINQSECHNMYPTRIDNGLGKYTVNLTGNYNNPSRESCLAHPEIYNYTIDVFHEAGAAWLQDVAGGIKPFFMYLSYTIPHAGGWEDTPYTNQDGNPVPTIYNYDDPSWPDVEKDHAAVITYLDAKVGDLMQRLKMLGLDDNTLVVFASDNGAHQEGGHMVDFFDSSGGLQGYKRSLFEGGVRSPIMARWPGTIEAGRESDLQWAFWDVMPTLADLAQTRTPATDGISIVPELKGEGQQPEHEYLYWTWGGGYAVRVGNWKGVVPACLADDMRPSLDDEMFLYNVVDDLSESRDLSAEHADQVESLKNLVIAKGLSCQGYLAR